jgi:hypothetical protein
MQPAANLQESWPWAGIGPVARLILSLFRCSFKYSLEFMQTFEFHRNLKRPHKNANEILLDSLGGDLNNELGNFVKFIMLACIKFQESKACNSHRNSNLELRHAYSFIVQEPVQNHSSPFTAYFSGC